MQFGLFVGVFGQFSVACCLEIGRSVFHLVESRTRLARERVDFDVILAKLLAAQVFLKVFEVFQDAQGVQY